MEKLRRAGLLLVLSPLLVGGDMLSDKAHDNVVQASAAVAVVPGFMHVLDMQWWNAHSECIIALCAVTGAVVSIMTFVAGQIRQRRR